jgi:beta-glucosidase
MTQFQKSRRAAVLLFPSAVLLFPAAILVFAACSRSVRIEERRVPQHEATRIPAEPHNPGRVAEIERRGKEPNPQLLFIGDSITEGWEREGKDVWAAAYAPLGALNYGVSGDQTQHVLWRILRGHCDGLEPKVTIVMIGTNNTGNGMPAEKTFDGVTGVVQRLRSKMPKSKILLLGIFPRGEKPDDPMRVKNKEINDRLAGLDDGDHIFFLDISEDFLEDDGTLTKEIMPDSLHLSPRGYEIWREAMAPKLAELLR